MEFVTKVCSKCTIPKSLNEFHKRNKSKDGYRNECIKCKKINDKSYYEFNKENVLISSRNWRKNNLDKVKEKDENYRKNNSDKIKTSHDKHCRLNPDNIKENNKRWREANPDKVNELARKYNKNNPHVIAHRNILRHCLESFDKIKEGHTINLLGYSAADLKNHIERLFTDGMSWGNYGEWHIDHIKPVSKFIPNTPMTIVNALNNLQPLWATTREINGIIFEGNLNKYNKF